jgi:hypothetical protein
MATYNLSKIAKKNDTSKPYNQSLEDSNKDFGTQFKEEDAKNINLKLKIKDKDNTIPFETQLSEARIDKKADMITEKAMDKSKQPYNKRTMEDSNLQVSPINLLSESFDQKKAEAYKKAENKINTDTEFWDKYVGAQLLGEATKVKNNPTGSQLANNPSRFNIKDDVTKIVDTKVEKMVFATIKDADALLFHVYATAAKENREVNTDEQAFINRINAEKEFIIAQNMAPSMDAMTSNNNALMFDEDNIVIIKHPDGSVGVYENGQILVDETGKEATYTKPNAFENVADARDDYPEATVIED